MEKRIKTLYIITIIAILSFLGMQFYWLYVRYDTALKDYERGLAERIAKCVDAYNEIRWSHEKKSGETNSPNRDDGCDVFSIPRVSLQQRYGDTIKTTRSVKIYTYVFSAHRLLGIRPGTPLTNAQKKEVVALAEKQLTSPADSAVFDASGARDENEAWTAARNIGTERECRFTSAGIDSVLEKSGIKARVSLSQADSAVWTSKTEYHTSAFSPGLSVTMPYSQLEGKSVTIAATVNALDILPGMWQTLTVTFVVSALLIVCLVLQFKTVLKLSRLDRMRNSFVTTMIHELKRPISTLKMCVSGLDNERMVYEPTVRKELLSETRHALDNLSAYFSKLRDITFNNVEQIPLNIGGVNLHELFGRVASATVIPAGKSVVIVNGIDKGLEVSADPSHLYNMLNNLVENAVKYSGPSVEIKATARAHDEAVEIRVSDTGNGISAVDMKHIFKRFYRGKASAGELPGMGLGLTYVKLLAEAHGGDISVDSAEGRGSCFTIRLPQ